MKRRMVLLLIMAVLLAGCARAPSTPTPMLLVPAPAERATPKPTEGPAPTPVEKPTLTPTPTPTREPTPTPTPTEKPPTPAPQVREIGEFTEEDRVLAEAQKGQAREFVYQKAEESGIKSSLFIILSVRNQEGVFTYIKSPEVERFEAQNIGVPVWYAWTPKGVVKVPLTARSSDWPNAVREWDEEDLRIEYVEHFDRVGWGWPPYDIPRAFFNPEKGEVENFVTLRSLAEKKGFKIGTSLFPGYMAHDLWYKDETPEKYEVIAASEFNSFFPAVATWDKHISKDAWNFTCYDYFVAFAERHKMEVYGPGLVYWRVPDWLKNGNYSQEEVQQILHDHITTLVTRYRGKINSWTVVGEAFGGQNEPFLQGFWAENIGPKYIEMAFRWAHEANPEAELYYEGNDCEGFGPWSRKTYGKRPEAVYNLVKGLVEKGVPIHGVALEMHVGIKGCPPVKWENRETPPIEEIRAYFDAIAKLGLKIRITEMEVSIGGQAPPTKEQLEEQAQIYRDIVQLCLDHPACVGVSLWGVTDKDTWMRSYHHLPYESPLLFDEEGNKKPAYWAVFDVLSRH